ncbi:hypothetical protein ACFWA9_23900 [Kitasatospora sp. NPDC059973]|uniref:hypothetical protein n=1 Tax=Kitasatospora sp. NPDC059973 TaxID=3347020 RepID=UPI003682F2A2
MIHGDLRAGVTVLSAEFAPDLVGGAPHGPVIAPPYLDGYAQDIDPATVLVPEVLRTEADDDPDEYRGLDAPKVHGGRLLRHIEEGLPITLPR